ncbi:glucose dehydrogenase [FAD, quinone]-like isoform X1 [Mytilus galloprovincialis]|uniref:glucose dehydrogenase [FAD, quinone]-like isoform X1 n=2 Tax=Mytilus galloprovincialis TaxID=29158 RepID=UPI003F7BB78A
MEDIPIPSLYDSPYHSRGGYLAVSKTGNTPLPELFRKASEELGYKTVDKNCEDQIGFSYQQSTVRNGERCSTVKAYLRPVMNRHNLHISINTMATKILIENRKAIGLEVIKNNRKVQVYANKEVILSGGAINSPVLLMLSGVGPKDHLHNLGIPVVADLPVGNNLQDHMMFPMKYNINSSISMNTQTFQAQIPKVQYALFKTGIYSGSGLEGDLMDKIPNRDPSEPDYPDYQMILYTVAQDEGFLDYGLDMNIKPEVTKLLKTRAKNNEFTHTLVGLHPKSRGTIRLQSTDPFDPPLIDPYYLENPYDIKVMIAAIRKSQQIMNTKVFKQLDGTLVRQDFSGICDKVNFDTDEYWECFIRYFTVTIYHPVSTCRMGAITDPSAVVDPELRVKGILNLRVADASVMRNEPSGNTNAPCIMIGEKAADLIRGNDTVFDFRKQIAKLKL